MLILFHNCSTYNYLSVLDERLRVTLIGPNTIIALPAIDVRTETGPVSEIGCSVVSTSW